LIGCAARQVRAAGGRRSKRQAEIDIGERDSAELFKASRIFYGFWCAAKYKSLILNRNIFIFKNKQPVKQLADNK